jgi:hypothetical protein
MIRTFFINLSLTDGNPERKGRSLPDFALHPDTPAVFLDNLFNDCKPQPMVPLLSLSENW